MGELTVDDGVYSGDSTPTQSPRPGGTGPSTPASSESAKKKEKKVKKGGTPGRRKLSFRRAKVAVTVERDTSAPARQEAEKEASTALQREYKRDAALQVSELVRNWGCDEQRVFAALCASAAGVAEESGQEAAALAAVLSSALHGVQEGRSWSGGERQEDAALLLAIAHYNDVLDNVMYKRPRLPQMLGANATSGAMGKDGTVHQGLSVNDLLAASSSAHASPMPAVITTDSKGRPRVGSMRARGRLRGNTSLMGMFADPRARAGSVDAEGLTSVSPTAQAKSPKGSSLALAAMAGMDMLGGEQRGRAKSVAVVEHPSVRRASKVDPPGHKLDLNKLKAGPKADTRGKPMPSPRDIFRSPRSPKPESADSAKMIKPSKLQGSLNQRLGKKLARIFSGGDAGKVNRARASAGDVTEGRLSVSAIRESKAVYGVSIDVLYVRTGRPVPELVELTAMQIVQSGLATSGIFRKGGLATRLEELRSIVDSGHVASIDWEMEDIETLASMFKLFFRELPDPLLPAPLYNELGVCCIDEKTTASDEARYAKERVILGRLSRAHRATLECLLSTLHAVVTHSAQNLMDAQNLGIVMGPNLVKPLGLTDPLAELRASGRVNKIVACLVTDAAHILSPERIASPVEERVELRRGEAFAVLANHMGYPEGAGGLGVGSRLCAACAAFRLTANCLWCKHVSK